MGPIKRFGRQPGILPFNHPSLQLSERRNVNPLSPVNRHWPGALASTIGRSAGINHRPLRAIPQTWFVNFPFRFYPVTTQWGVLVLAGPAAREVLQKLTDTDLSTPAFPWLSGQKIAVGNTSVHALRVNFVGELGWELHHPIEVQNTLFDLLMDAGRSHGIRPFGIRAMDSLRLEKSYRLIPRELSIEYAALESALERFIRPDKDFLGRDALLAWQARGFTTRFVTLEVHDVTDADARGNEPIYQGDKLVGRCTSGGYGWRLQRSLALGMVRPELAEIDTELEVEILGSRHKVTVIEESPFDAGNVRLRG